MPVARKKIKLLPSEGTVFPVEELPFDIFKIIVNYMKIANGKIKPLFFATKAIRKAFAPVFMEHLWFYVTRGRQLFYLSQIQNFIDPSTATLSKYNGTMRKVKVTTGADYIIDALPKHLVRLELTMRAPLFSVDLDKLKVLESLSITGYMDIDQPVPSVIIVQERLRCLHLSSVRLNVLQITENIEEIVMKNCTVIGPIKIPNAVKNLVLKHCTFKASVILYKKEKNEQITLDSEEAGLLFYNEKFFKYDRTTGRKNKLPFLVTDQMNHDIDWWLE